MNSLRSLTLPRIAAFLAASLLLTTDASATYLVTFYQSGSNVVAAGGGSINLNGLPCDTAGGGAGVLPSKGTFGVGPLGGNNPETACRLVGLTGPANFGPGGFTEPNAGTGDLLEFYRNTSYIYPYRGYVSNAYLFGTATWNNTTIANLGLTPGVYTWTWSSGNNVDSITAVIATAAVVEYYNPDLNNFFITADPTEQAFVETGAVGRWRRTGNVFRAGGSDAVCRFYGNGNINPATGTIYGPNSHFYTVNAAECAGLKAQYAANVRSWKFESNDFLTTPAVNGACAAGLVPVYRAYNNGFALGKDSNHRITSDANSYLLSVVAGWIGEGIVMCAAP